jgi:exonuclease VII small subunit
MAASDSRALVMAALLEDVQKTANRIEATIRKFNEIGTEENEFVKRRRIDETKYKTTIAELNKKVSELEDRDSVQINELYHCAKVDKNYEATIAELKKKVLELEDRDSVQVNELYHCAKAGKKYEATIAKLKKKVLELKKDEVVKLNAESS